MPNSPEHSERPAPAGKVVVTGAGGFLGRHVVRRLAEQGARVVALCGAEHELDRVRSLAAQAEAGDILETTLLNRHVAGADAVIHLAGPPAVRESFTNPVDFSRVHVLGTVAVAEACRRHHVRRLVYVSSAEVYGSLGLEPVSEHTPLRPRSPYGAAKASAETFVQTMVASSDTTAAILRPFSVFGPGGAPGAVVPTILRQALAETRIELARLTPVRDYCYIGDIARAVVLAAECDIAATTIVNLGSGTGTSVRQLAEVALEVVGRRLPIVQSASGDRPQSADVDQLVADVAMAESVLGWRPQVTLYEGLAHTVEHLKGSQ
ncbi:MAG: NAD-dependent epimerase/dehydratase family protein [Planctomycetota bacterium]|nr:MAG: NAD-dependent epimerase/dehydratase family protein [Planctomycetota bacterium]